MDQTYHEKSGTALTSDERIKQDPLAILIVSIINAMEADYGRVFSKHFSEPDVLKNYKRRLYQKLKGFPLDCVVDGYEDAAELSPRFCPTVHQLLESISKIIKNRKKHKERECEAKKLSDLPAPTHHVNTIEELSKAKKASLVNHGDDALRLKQLDSAKRNHTAVLNIHSAGIEKKYVSDNHLCRYSGCSSSGSISSGLQGGDNFYCKEHFRAT